MTYTISQIAQKMGVSVYTLRYYDKEGLLPFVERVNGRRVFKDSDFSWLRMISCLKNTGMPLKEIRQYMELCQLGDASLLQRQEIILKQKKSIEDQIHFLQENLKVIHAIDAILQRKKLRHRGNLSSHKTSEQQGREFAQVF